MSSGGLPAFHSSLHRIAGYRLSFPRQNHRGHALRAHLSGPQKNQFQPGLCRSGRRHQRSARRHRLVSFMDYDLGYFDLETRVLEPLENPFGPKVLPMLPVHCVTHVSGLDRKTVEPRAGLEPATCRLGLLNLEQIAKGGDLRRSLARRFADATAYSSGGDRLHFLALKASSRGSDVGTVKINRARSRAHATWSPHLHNRASTALVGEILLLRICCSAVPLGILFPNHGRILGV